MDVAELKKLPTLKWQYVAELKKLPTLKWQLEKVEKTTQYIPQIPPKAQQWQYLRILEVGIKLGLKKEN